jgi:hypothetical protein
LPFLPEILGKLALIPGNTSACVAALLACDGMVSEVMKALTQISQFARLASRVQVGSAVAARPEAKLIADMAAFSSGSARKRVASLKLHDCDPHILRGYIRESLMYHNALSGYPRNSSKEAKEALQDTLKVWVHAIRKSDTDVLWRQVLTEMEEEVKSRGGLEELVIMIEYVSQHVAGMPLTVSQSGAMVAVCRELFERVLSSTPVSQQEDLQQKPDMDKDSRSSLASLDRLRWKIISEVWPELVSQGCEEGEVHKLLACCPQGGDHKEVLATRIVNAVIANIQKAKQGDETIALKYSVAHNALRWLAKDAARFLPTLVKLWPKVVVGSNADELLSEALDVLAIHACNVQSTAFVHSFVTRNPCGPRHLRRKAVKWLSCFDSRAAVQLWPKAVFDPATKSDSGMEKQDVVDLLAICQKDVLDVPEFPVKISAEILAVLVESEMPQARLAAVRGLQDMDLKGKDKLHSSLLNGLRTDSSTIVAASARLAWRSIFRGKDVGASSSGGDEPEDDLHDLLA